MTQSKTQSDTDLPFQLLPNLNFFFTEPKCPLNFPTMNDGLANFSDKDDVYSSPNEAGFYLIEEQALEIPKDKGNSFKNFIFNYIQWVLRCQTDFLCLEEIRAESQKKKQYKLRKFKERLRKFKKEYKSKMLTALHLKSVLVYVDPIKAFLSRFLVRKCYEFLQRYPQIVKQKIDLGEMKTSTYNDNIEVIQIFRSLLQKELRYQQPIVPAHE